MQSDAYSTMATGFGFTLGGMLVVAFAVYFALVFVLGLMFYYFTGNKPGESIIRNFMRIASRFYSETWMLSSAYIVLGGLFLLLKVIIGSIFNGFVYAIVKYGAASGYDPRQIDLQTGLILLLSGLVLYAIHWGFSFAIETKEEKQGTFLSKIFNFAGLFTSGGIFFGSIVSFALQLVGYFQTGPSTFGSKPGVTLALVLAAAPIWFFYAIKAVWVTKKESSK